nr:MAG TPA: hypothetical protein [Caudoviricetes sp.]
MYYKVTRKGRLESFKKSFRLDNQQPSFFYRRRFND